MNQLQKLIILILLIIVIQLKKTTDYSTKINEIEKKITDHDHDKYITTQEFNKLTSDNFTVRLTQANLTSKNDISYFNDKLKNLNKKVTSNKKISSS